MQLLAIAAALLLEAPSQPKSTSAIAKEPPRVIAKSICEYSNSNPAYGDFTLTVVFRFHELRRGKPLDTPPEATLLNLTCGMGYGAKPDPNYVCHAAYLRLDNLLNGLPISSTDLGPISSAWTMEEFRVVERSGSVFRLASAVKDPAMPGGVTATIIADLSTGHVTFTRHQEMGDSTADRQGEAQCQVKGWFDGRPVKAYWEK